MTPWQIHGIRGARATRRLSLNREACQHCGRLVPLGNLERHERACASNPANMSHRLTGKCLACGLAIRQGASFCYRCGENDPRMAELDAALKNAASGKCCGGTC